jgi:glycosyltransferase involved in cell wall biosynthesis
MRIWLVQSGEEMPVDGIGTRLMRTALLANELTLRGHEVTYWNATFNHQKKIQRFDQTTKICQNESYKTIYLHGRSYRNNISLARIFSQMQNAAEFRRLAPNEPRPDVILCGFPTIELAVAVTDYAKKRKIAVAIDCRDMWPDIFQERLPNFAKCAASPLLARWEHLKVRCMRNASAITGITQEFVEWGLRSAQRPQSELDIPFHLSISSEAPSQKDIAAARDIWLGKFGKLDDNALICCFAGSLSKRLDLSTLLFAADILAEEDQSGFRIVLCGNGDQKRLVSDKAKSNPVLIYPGWCGRAELVSLMQISACGLLPYPNTPDFLASFPNKIGEYLMSGLPVLTALNGATDRMLAPHGLKIAYSEGDHSSLVAALRDFRKYSSKDDLRYKAEKLGRQHFNPEYIYPAFADWLERVSDLSEGQT